MISITVSVNAMKDDVKYQNTFIRPPENPQMSYSQNDCRSPNAFSVTWHNFAPSHSLSLGLSADRRVHLSRSVWRCVNRSARRYSRCSQFHYGHRAMTSSEVDSYLNLKNGNVMLKQVKPQETEGLRPWHFHFRLFWSIVLCDVVSDVSLSFGKLHYMGSRRNTL